MGRDAHSEGIGRRVRERIEKSLSRRDPEGALEATLCIPAAARLAILDPVGTLLQTSAPGLQRQGAWGRLHVLAARAESEPRLLLPLSTAAGAGEPSSEQSWQTRWALLLACLHAQDWARASRYLAGLQPVLDARALALGQALAAWIDRRGQLHGDILGSLQAAIPEAASPDPRLGYEAPSRERASLPPPPATAEEVERQVIALAATQPFLTFAETVLAWQAKASAALAPVLARAAAPLAVREMLIALTREARPVEPALLLGRLARGVPPDDLLAAELQLGVRLALPSLTSGPMDRKSGSALHELAAGAARQVGAQAFVVDWLTAREADASIRAAWLRVAEGFLGGAGQTVDAELRLRVWAAALSTWIRERHGEDEPQPLPSWLQATTEKVLEQGQALGTFVRSLPSGPRKAVLAAVLARASLTAATSLLGVCWDGADEEGRRELSPMVVALMERAEEEIDDTDLMAELGDRSMLGRLMRAFVEGGEDGLPPLVGPLGAVWRRVGERAVRYHPELLAWALSDTRSASEARRRIDQYREGRRDVEVMLEAMRAVAQTERDDLAVLLGDLQREMLRSFAGDPASLARALRWARTRKAPGSLIQDIAQALLEAAASHSPPSSPPTWASELEVARQLAGKKTGKKRRNGRSRPPPKVAAPSSGAGKSGRRDPVPTPIPARATTTGTPRRGRTEAERRSSSEPDDRSTPQLGLPFDDPPS